MNGTWIDDRRIRVGTTTFIAGATSAGLAPDEFLVIKPPALVRRYLDLLAGEAPRNVVELGVKDGGSAALMMLVAEPHRLLAVDLANDIPPLLSALIDDHGLDGRLVPAFGLDQGDKASLTAAADACFGDDAIDIVIDDASHVLEPTRRSFETLFPLLRPGGLFVIEDWSTECLAAARLAPTMSHLPDFERRVDAATQVIRVLNTPGEELPPAVVATMAEVHARRVSQGEDVGEGPEALFSALVQAAAEIDPASVGGPSGRARPLADLTVELTMIAASAPGTIAEVIVDADWVSVRRGPDDLLSGFRLDDAWSDFFGYLS